MNSKSPIWVVAVIFYVVSLMGAASITYKYQENKYNDKINKIQKEAHNTYLAELGKVLDRERALQESVQKLEIESNDKLKEINSLRARNRQLVRNAGGLRDPGSRESGNSPKGKDSSTSGNPKADTGQILSGKTTDFLLNLAADADEIREQLRLCQQWAKRIAE